MPKTVPCPTCETDVKVPRDAEPGDRLTCPNCDEVFTPPHLRKKAHDPTRVAAYGVGDVEEDPDRAEKRRKTKAIMRHGRQAHRDERKSAPRPFFGGFELVLVLIALGATLALVTGFALAKRFPNTGEGLLIILCYCGMLGAFAVKMLRTSSRIGG